MKKNLLSALMMAGMTICGQNAMAGDWTVPTEPGGMEPSNGAKVMLYNVEAELCMGNGKISANWATSAILVEENPLVFELKDNGDDTWSIITASGSHNGKYLFTPTAENDHPYCFVDMAGDWQGDRKFTMTALPNGNYTLAFTNYDLAPEGTFFGTDGMTLDVVCNADPEEGAWIEWQFLPSDGLQIYQTRCTFYEALIEAEDYVTIDIDKYGDVYENPDATLEELTKALSELRVAITEAQMREDGYDPTPDNPLDLTANFLQNPTFDDDVNGWTNIGGMTHDPNGTPYGSEEDGNYVQSFCEKWAAGVPLGKEYGIYQTVNLPAGRWRLEANVIASAQYAGDITVKGVKLYAKQGEQEYAVKCATGNNAPHHYVIDFIALAGESTEIGLHIDADTEANWVAVDNFTLSFCGKSEMSGAYMALMNSYESAQSSFPEATFEELEANINTKAAYQMALDEAAGVLADETSSDEACQAAMDKLNEAAATLQQSVDDYRSLNNLVNSIMALENQLYDYTYDDLVGQLDELASKIGEGIGSQEWTSEELAAVTAEYNTYNDLFNLIIYCDGRIEAYQDDQVLVDMITKERDALVADWSAGTYTSAEQVAQKKTAIETAISEYLNAQLKGNEDITSMLVNPNFDENYDGWNLNGFDGPGYSYSEVEYFQKNFNMSQTLRSMPRGRYTLTVQGYQRRSEVNAVLYANENEKLLWSAKDKANSFGFFPGDGTGSYPNDSYDSNEGIYYPNSMEGARQWFDQTEEDGTPYYTNKLDFLLLDASTDVTIGVKSSGNNGGGDWCLFDNFTLFYHGNTATAYADYLNELIEKLNETMDLGYTTADMKKQADAAISQAQEAIKSNNGDACIAAIPVLEEAIENAQANILTTSLLADFLEATDYRITDIQSTTKNDFQTYVDEVKGKLISSEIANLEECHTYYEEVNTKLTECVQHDGLSIATEEKPWNMTAAILNPEYEFDYAADMYEGDSYNSYGWNGDTPSCNEYSAEFWNNEWAKGVEINQTLYGLAPGYYKLHVLGYNRQGYGNEGYGSHSPKDFETYATLYAGDYQTRLCDVLDYKQTEKLCDPDDSDMNESELEDGDITYYYPGNMPSSRIYFDEGYYQNTLIFKVEEGQKQITFGLSKTTFHTWDSLMFDNWTLDYVGTTEPTEQSTDITTATMAATAAVKFYTTDGIELSRPAKGINLVKVTDVNGNTSVRKMMVK